MVKISAREHSAEVERHIVALNEYVEIRTILSDYLGELNRKQVDLAWKRLIPVD